MITIPRMHPLVRGNLFFNYFLDKLCKDAMLISGICFLTLTFVFVIIFVCGLSHPILLGFLISSVCLGLSLVFIGILLNLRTSCPMPEVFLSLIRNAFPKVIYDLAYEQRLQFHELRDILLGLSSGNLLSLSDVCRWKVEQFGIERLQAACNGCELISFKDLLLTQCPFYFFNEFIKLGPKEFPEAENMNPESYWFSRLGLSDSFDTIFHINIWMFARYTSQQEYEALIVHAKNSTWDQVKFSEHDLAVKKIATPWLLYLCKHGVTWEQLKLLGKLYDNPVSFLYNLEKMSGGGDLARIVSSISNYIHEDSEEFDPSIALITWKEWMHNYAENMKNPNWSFYEGTIDFLNRRSRNVLHKIEHEEDVPYYTINKVTGERSRV
ncbi:DUF1389 domain-containing protein [Chlamydia sp. 12-01]|uniref:DUF1389 domain-containing protein n=1 Tax=Chlamydia sp. 12-01 TaxID=3002742 RepID=UPI0035D48A40